MEFKDVSPNRNFSQIITSERGLSLRREIIRNEIEAYFSTSKVLETFSGFIEAVSSKLPEIVDVRVFNTLPVKEARESRVFLYANSNTG